MDRIDGIVRGIFSVRWFELNCYDTEHAYKRDEHDPFTINDLGFVLYRSIRGIVFPGIIIRFYFINIR